MARTIHRFLGFELDDERFELRHADQLIPTPTRVFSVIVYLLRHRDRVVSKRELIQEVWKAKVASDTAISQVVMLARRALSDERETHRVIKTVRGRGFRFIAEVEAIEALPGCVQAVTPGITLLKPRASDGLVGRGAELAVLVGAMTDLLQRRGRLLWVEGEPGIGKTTLVGALESEALARKIEVRWGRVWEGGGAPPFWPFVHILRGFAQRDGLPAMRQFMGRGENQLLRLMPEWASGESVAQLDIGSASARFGLFDAMSRFLRNACGAKPCLIILDDLHAADHGSIELVHFLASELSDTPLSIVATVRDLELAGNPTLARLADAVDERHRIRLTGLSSEEVAALVVQRFGKPATPRALHTLTELSGGNPLLLGEMCRHVGPSGLDAYIEPSALASMTPPERVASAVRKQLSDLPPATAHALSIASVLGREFSMPFVAALCEITEVELVERLAPAMARGLLRPSGAGEQRTFSHALVHSAIYAEQPDATRLALHRRIAETLEQQPEATPQRRLALLEIAHHYGQAAALGCRGKALDYTQRAADYAVEIASFDLAASLYDRALSLAAAQGSDAETHHSLLCRAGEAWLKAGQTALAAARFDRAVAEAQAEQHPERFAAAVLRATYAARGGMLHDSVRRQQLLEALAMLPEADSELRAYTLGASAVGMRGRQHLGARDAITRAAVEMAERLGSDAALLRTLSLRHVALWGAAHPRAVLEIADQIVELGSRSNNRDHVLDALLIRTSHRLELGDRSGLWRDLEHCSREVQRHGSPWHAYILSSVAPVQAVARGDFASAEQLSEHVLQRGLRVHDPLAAASHAVRCLFLQLDRGVRHLPPSTAASSEPPAFVPEDYHPFWALWWVNTRQRSRAAQAMRRLLAHDWEYVVSDTLRRPLLAAAGQVCSALGDRASLGQIYETMLPDAGLHLLLQVGVELGPVSHHLGSVAAALERYDAAEAHFKQALCEGAPQSPWYLRTQAEYGRLLLRRGVSRGRELLHEAGALAEQYGMRDLHDDVQQAMQQNSALVRVPTRTRLKVQASSRH